MTKKIMQYKAVSLIGIASLGFVLGGFFWAYSALHGAGPFILHFDDINGITSVGDASTIIFMGVIGVVIVVFNFFIALELEARDRFLGKFLIGITLLLSVLLFIAFATILNVNV